MATVTSAVWESVVAVRGVNWDTYVELRENPENNYLRMTYDNGRLEIVERSPKHGRCGGFLDKIISAWAEELDVPICCFGGMTCQREDIAKGFEPDVCYYVQNWQRVLGKWEFDFTVDPPPDLAIEIEMSQSVMEKINSVYAAFGVPEVWRYDGNQLQVYELVEGEYRERKTSLSFPHFPLEKAEELAQRLRLERQQEILRGFGQWVRETFLKGERRLV